MLSRRRSSSMSTTIVLTMLIVAIVPSLAFEILFSRIMEDDLLEQTEHSNLLSVSVLSDKTSQSFSYPLSELASLRERILSTGKPARVFKDGITGTNAALLFRRIELTDWNGNVAAAWPSGNGRIGASLPGRSFKDKFDAGYGYYFSPCYNSYDTSTPVVDLIIPCGEGQLIGTLDVAVIQKYLSPPVSDRDTVIGILDRNGVWLASTNTDLTNSTETSAMSAQWAAQPEGRQDLTRILGQRYIPFTKAITNSEWSIVILSSIESLQNKLDYLKMALRLTVIVLLITGLGFLSLINAKVKKQIRSILDFAERISAGRYAFLLPPKMFREMEELLGRFEDMAKKIEKRELEIHEKNRSILTLNSELEARVERRTQQLRSANQDLEKTLDALKETQLQLIETERMANLGNLVAGVAHEINTPLGVSFTAATFLEQQLNKIKTGFENNQLRRQTMDHILKSALESVQIITTNLSNAAEMIRTFKQIAVDRSLGEARRINVPEYLEAIVLSLKPELRNHTVTIDIYPEKVELNCNPGDFSQVIGNLLTNAVRHGFEAVEHGHIDVSGRIEGNALILKICDDGSGVPEQNIKSIFEPFFTTKRGSGGTGLGLNIVYNIITQKFGGMIRCDSEPGNGTCFTISIPLDQTPPQPAENLNSDSA